VGEVDSRLLAALLTGVRRAFPYLEAAEADQLAGVHGDSLFRLVHQAPFGVATQALALLFQIVSSQSAVSDRFSRCVLPD
jgi:ribosome biogenesis protein MAK21